MSHIPVLLNEVLNQFNYLADRPNGYFVDGTLGAGGHSVAITQSAKRKSQNHNLKLKTVGIDKDLNALEIARKNISYAGLSDQFILVHNDFKNIRKILADLKVDKINGALIDLGVSSMQLDRPERGFSFADPKAPLDMRMDQSSKTTAADILNSWPRQKLAEMLKEIGEERFAGLIAAEIVKYRQERTITSVGDLLAILTAAIPAKVRATRNKHFATNTFRALRIVVNDELAHLDRAIADFVDVLSAGGKLAVITFHSTEDRIVKNTFKKLENPCVCPPDLPHCVCGKKPVGKIMTTKPIIPTEEEIRSNPRSRSAKLRVIEKH